MSRTKKHDPRKRILRTTLADVRRHGIMVVHVEPSGRQGLISCKSGISVAGNRVLAEGIVGFPHHWTICLAVFCRSDTEEYMKSVDLTPDRAFKSETLAHECESEHRNLEAGCNAKHVIGTGFLASPVGKKLTSDEAGELFRKCGAWQQEQFLPESERSRLIAALEGAALGSNA